MYVLKSIAIWICNLKSLAYVWVVSSARCGNKLSQKFSLFYSTVDCQLWKYAHTKFVVKARFFLLVDLREFFFQI